MAKGGGGSVFLLNGDSYLPVKKYSDGTYCVGSKIRQREGTRGGRGGAATSHGLKIDLFF